MKIKYILVVLGLVGPVLLNGMSSVGEITTELPFQIEAIKHCQKVFNTLYIKANDKVYSLRYEKSPLEQNYWGKLSYIDGEEQVDLYIPEDLTEEIYEHCSVVPSQVNLVAHYKQN